jgi:NitT/TauT family transport system permease protein
MGKNKSILPEATHTDNSWGRVAKTLYRWFRKSIAIILFFVIWDSLVRFGVVDKVILATVTDILESFKTNILNGQLFIHIGASLKRTGSGFLLAIAVGTVLGLLIGWFKKVEEYLDPLLNLLRNTSVLAMFPVFILAFGLGETAKIAIVFWGSLWSCLISTISGVKGIDPILIKSARSMGTPPLSLFRKVIFPAVLPEILTGVRLSANVAVIILVAAEMLGANKGLGYFIFQAQQKYNVPQMYMGIICLSILGVVVNFVLVKLEKKLVAWKIARA